MTLVGCYSRGRKTNHMSLGLGVIGIQRCVFAGTRGVDYKQISGFRSVIPGMSQWLRMRSMKDEYEFDDRRLSSLVLTLKSPDPIPLHHRLSLLARPSFGYQISAYGDTTEITERVIIETTCEDESLCTWEEHEELHDSIRELMGLSAWKPFNLSELRAQRRDDPHRVLDGTPVGDRWAPVLRNGITDYPVPDGHIRFMFTFEDLGADGIRRWVDLRTGKYSRGIQPVLDLHLPRGVPIETQVAQSGIGLDGIGYLLALDANVSKSTANDEPHACRLRRVWADLGDIQMPFTEDDWVDNSARAYNATKHANRKMPTVEELVEVRRMNQLVFRVWAAIKIGLSAELLSERIKMDPMNKPIEFL